MALFGQCQHSFFLVIEKLRFYQLKYQLFPQKSDLHTFILPLLFVSLQKSMP